MTSKFLCVLFLIAINFLCSSESGAAPTAEIDFRDKPISGNQVYVLDGQWEFYWDRYVFSGEIAEKPQLFPTALAWTRYSDGAGKPYPAFGKATYKTKILLPENHGPLLAIQLKRVKMDYAVFADGKLVSYKGKMLSHEHYGEDNNITGIVAIPVTTDQKSIELIIQVSNQDYFRGGLDQQLLFSNYSTLAETRQIRIIQASLISGALFIMAFYHFFLWIRQRDNKSTILFCLFTLGFAFRVFFDGEKMMYLFNSQLTETIMIRFEMASSYFALPIMHLFVASVFPDEFNRRILIIPKIVWVLLMSVILFMPLYYVGTSLYFGKIYFSFALLHILYVAIRATINNRECSRLFLLGFLVAFCAGFNDMLFENGKVHTMYLFQYGVLCFIFVQSTIHSYRFASAYQELQSLKNNLKLQVESRTQDLAQVNSELTRAHSETKLLNNAMTSFIEDERKMLSRELHDDIGATLTGIRFNINTACKKLSDVGSIPTEIIKTIQNAEESINILYQKVRGMVRKLRPEIIDTLGLETALNELVFSYSDLKIDLRVEGDCSKVSSECGLAIYRISQEAITNVLKYANASEIILKVVVENDLHFSIKDNGQGFDTELTTGIGLISMRERATGLGGSFSIESNHGKGTEITVSIPLARDKSNIV